MEELEELEKTPRRHGEVRKEGRTWDAAPRNVGKELSIVVNVFPQRVVPSLLTVKLESDISILTFPLLLSTKDRRVSLPYRVV